MRLISDRLPDLPRPLPNLYPTFAQPQSRRRKALPDLPNLIARAYMEMQPSSSFKKSQSGWVGWVGRAEQGAAMVSSCPTSAQPAAWSGNALSCVIHGRPRRAAAARGLLNVALNGEATNLNENAPLKLNRKVNVKLNVRLNLKLNGNLNGSRVLLGLGSLRVIRTPLFMHLSFRALVPNGTGMAA
ncbi:hypothetical protein GGR59_000356 [Xanthomonas arboricola]|uniref:hypothetical protein n=1 Tax=Xanthomonas arboricola TaxID=56448 RepID=UPI00161B3DD0|nr:hypothetical protein [Xanthomonas arboricola]MBB4604151.1 hypothetical protein [Xanthomonas arboricola]